jgi:hypothetical protein
MLAELPARHPARGELQRLITEIRAESWIDDALELDSAKERLKELGDALEAIERRHPGVVKPNAPVPHATPEPVPEAVPEHAEPAAAPAPTEHVLPENLDPPGTEYKRPKARQTGAQAKDDIPGWVKGDRYRPPRVGENGNQYAKRLLDHKFGAGKWSEGPGTDFNKIKKWANEHFE